MSEDGPFPHPLFGHGPWKIEEKLASGDIKITEFDGETIGERTLINVSAGREAIRRARSTYVDSNGFTKDGDGRHIASIPPALWMNWERKYGAQALATDKKLLKRLIKEYGCAVVSGSF